MGSLKISKQHMVQTFLSSVLEIYSSSKPKKKKKNEVIPKWKIEITWNGEFRENPVRISNFVRGSVVLPHVSKWGAVSVSFNLTLKACDACASTLRVSPVDITIFAIKSIVVY